jgi:hypothetical protein
MATREASTSPERRNDPAWRPNRRTWTLLFLVALLIVILWPPSNDTSLALKAIHWAVDPSGGLPVLPPQLGPGLSDDPAAVEARDALVRRYDEFYDRGRWMRLRLALKVARDPFEPGTERQLLLLAGVMVGFLAWRYGRED